MDSENTDFKKRLISLSAVTGIALFIGFFVLLSAPKPVPSETKRSVAAQSELPKEMDVKTPEAPRLSGGSQEFAASSPAPNKAFEKLQSAKAVRELLKDSKNQLKETERVEGQGVATTKFQHFYQGLEVIGSVAMYHNGPAGEQLQTHLSQFVLNTHPKVSAAEAEEKAKAKLGDRSLVETDPVLKILPPQKGHGARLIYSITLKDANSSSHEVWIDAHSGEIVADIAHPGFRDPL